MGEEFTTEHRRCVAGWPCGQTRKATKTLRDTKGGGGLVNHGKHGSHGKVFVSGFAGFRAFSCSAPQGIPKGSVSFSVPRNGFQCVQWQKTLDAERGNLPQKTQKRPSADTESTEGVWRGGLAAEHESPLRGTRNV